MFFLIFMLISIMALGVAVIDSRDWDFSQFNYPPQDGHSLIEKRTDLWVLNG